MTPPSGTAVWMILIVVFAAGAIGGLTNALITDNGFILPRRETSKDVQIVRPGFLVNMFIGGVAACISWGLYGPFAAESITKTLLKEQPSLTLAALMGAVLVGVAGARWLTNEVDKNLLRGAAVKAAKAPGDPAFAETLALAPPAEAFRQAASKSE